MRHSIVYIVSALTYEKPARVVAVRRDMRHSIVYIVSALTYEKPARVVAVRRDMRHSIVYIVSALTYGKPARVVAVRTAASGKQQLTAADASAATSSEEYRHVSVSTGCMVQAVQGKIQGRRTRTLVQAVQGARQRTVQQQTKQQHEHKRHASQLRSSNGRRRIQPISGNKPRRDTEREHTFISH